MSMRSPIFATFFAAGMALSSVAGADQLHDQYLESTRPSGVAMIGDVLVARPLLVAGTVIGAGIFVVASPFTLAGGNVGEVWDTWVMLPARNAFQRCLGCTPVQNDNLRADRRLAKTQGDSEPVAEAPAN